MYEAMKPNQWLRKMGGFTQRPGKIQSRLKRSPQSCTIVSNNGAVKSPVVRFKYDWQWQLFAHNDTRTLTLREELKLIRDMRISLLDTDTPTPNDWQLLQEIQQLENKSLAAMDPQTYSE